MTRFYPSSVVSEEANMRFSEAPTDGAEVPGGSICDIVYQMVFKLGFCVLPMYGLNVLGAVQKCYFFILSAHGLKNQWDCCIFPRRV